MHLDDEVEEMSISYLNLHRKPSLQSVCQIIAALFFVHVCPCDEASYLLNKI